MIINMAWHFIYILNYWRRYQRVAFPENYLLINMYHHFLEKRELKRKIDGEYSQILDLLEIHIKFGMCLSFLLGCF